MAVKPAPVVADTTSSDDKKSVPRDDRKAAVDAANAAGAAAASARAKTSAPPIIAAAVAELNKAAPGTPRIYQAIVDVMRDVEAISKDRSAPQYKFRGIDEVYNELHAHLARHGVFTVPTLIRDTRDERQTKNGGMVAVVVLQIQFRFYAVDGSYIDALVTGEGQDSGDKAANKAMSVAHKYCLLQVFCIPTADPKDPENDHDERVPRGQGGGAGPGDDWREKVQPAPAAAAKAPAPAAPPPAPHVRQEQARAAAAAGGTGERRKVAVDMNKQSHADWLNAELDKKKIGAEHHLAIAGLMNGRYGSDLDAVIDVYMNPPQTSPDDGQAATP